LSGCSSHPGLLREREGERFGFRQRTIKGLTVRTLDELSSLTDDEIDIATGALLASAELEPSVDIEKYLRLLDSMAIELGKELEGVVSPELLAYKLREYIFFRRKFNPSSKEKEIVEAVEPCYIRLDKVLETKVGNCLGMSLLYLSLAERLGVPLSMVTLPPYSDREKAHAFVRYVGKSRVLNIETAFDGLVVPDSFYHERFRNAISMRAQSFQTPLSKKQVIAVILHCFGTYYSEEDDKTAMALLKKSLSFWPDDVTALSELGSAQLRTGRNEEGLANLRRALEISPRDVLPSLILFGYYGTRGECDKVVEIGRRFLSFHPRHPSADSIQLALYFTAADPTSGSKYTFTSVEECEAALKFVREYPDKHRQRSSEEDAILERLPKLLEQRKKELLEGREKDNR
jgi:regulator of sirC expression with transglutaminase-like and TPR domain